MCMPHPDPHRNRIFCCDPPSGSNLFLPVPLKDLFPAPPVGDDIKASSHIKTDDTWGGAHTGNDEDDSIKSAMASPTEIHISVDKRDGSHWVLF
ncbi:hypothetical protein ColLi_11332 [Colletotrichum liriopes]|uniref:Uncharacterized protein n=1 Tax=Colletotrichum liriopes TaxID=708192 RepID=A0AA37LXM6_9PEZI|nr:hypothetical protein ColLi_11332 [Colletotrichum liriopes]